jgi:NitT/TauT family transport system substrate-binding protein
MKKGITSIACFLSLLLIMAFVAGCGTKPAQDGQKEQKELQKVVYCIPQKEVGAGAESLYYAVPKQLGYFEEEGLDVVAVNAESSIVGLQLLGSGKVDTGQGTPSGIMSGALRGIPAKMVYNLIPAYGSGLAVLDGSPLKTIKDLQKGMKIGVYSLSDGRVAEVKSMIKFAGFKEDEISILAVGGGNQAAAALTSGDVDGLFLWEMAYNTIDQAGIKLRVIRDVFPNNSKMLDYVVYFSNKMIEEKPEVVAGYGRALAKGLLWSLNNPEGALDLFYKEFPKYKATNEKNRAIDVAIISSYAKQHDITGTDINKFGLFPDDYVAFTAEFLNQAGLLESYTDSKIFYASQFVDQYNDFDKDAVIKSAKEYKPSL